MSRKIYFPLLVLSFCFSTQLPGISSVVFGAGIPEFSDRAQAVLKEYCSNCHSDEYDRSLPSKEIDDARDEVDYSIWDSYSPRQQVRLADKSVVSMEDGDMPSEDFLKDHPDKRPSAEELELLINEFKQLLQ